MSLYFAHAKQHSLFQACSWLERSAKNVELKNRGEARREKVKERLRANLAKGRSAHLQIAISRRASPLFFRSLFSFRSAPQLTEFREEVTYRFLTQLNYRLNPGGGGGVLPYKGLMGTCGQPGYVFWDFCLKQGIDFIIFCLNQGIAFINFCLKTGIFSWTINSLCSTT